jgi:predicted phosphodiesterase
MTKIDFVSDLHIEFNDNLYLEKNDSDAKYLVLGGDIVSWSYLQEHRTDAKARSVTKRFNKFLKEWAGNYDTIFYVPGNHEYYGHYLDSTEEMSDKLKGIDERLMLMNNDLFIENDFAIFFSTFWTDLDNNDPMAHLIYKEGMNDVIYIKKDKEKTVHFTSEMMYEEHLEAFDQFKWYYSFCKENLEPIEKFVCFTHHSPVMASHNERRFGRNGIEFGYHSNYDEMIHEMTIDYWIIGHTHSDVDFDLGGTKFTSNMYGYNGYERKPSNKLKVKGIEV